MTTAAARELVEPAWTVRSGIETLSPDAGWYGQLVGDRDGPLWTLGYGRLVRYDPAAGSAQTWTVDDDARFAATTILAARAGGVWLIGQRAVRRFDGSAFSDAVDLEASITVAATAPDGSLWAATTDGALVHLVGDRRVRIDALRPNPRDYLYAMTVDARGHVWCAWNGSDGNGGWLSRYDGSSWRVFGDEEVVPPTGWIGTLAALPDGSVWVGAGSSLLRFDGSAWSDLRVPNVTSVSSGPDGVVWVVTSDPNSGAPGVGRLEHGSWTMYASSEGLPHEGGGGAIVVADGEVYLGAGSGIYRLAGRGWERAWVTDTEAGPTGGGALIAASRDEAWAMEGPDLWHYAEGTWSSVAEPLLGYGPSGVLRTGDGTLWAADEGAYILTGRSWSRFGTWSASALAVDRKGVVWAATSDVISNGWVVHAIGQEAGRWVDWGPTPSTGLMPPPHLLAVGADGTIWAAAPARTWRPGGASFVRYRDGHWESISPRGVGVPFEVEGLVPGRGGDLWVAGMDAAATDPYPGEAASWLARFDGVHWTIFRPWNDLGAVWDMAAGPDGSIWLATSDGLRVFDGSSWTTRYAGTGFMAVSVAPDGSVWANGPSGIERITAQGAGRSSGGRTTR